MYPNHLLKKSLSPTNTAHKHLNLKTYGSLKRCVSETFIEGRKLAQEAVEYEKARTYWTVGAMIEKHVMLNEKRGDYGKKIVNQLAKDLDTNQTLLYYALQFARTYKEFPQDKKLSWSHYRALLPVKNDEERSKLEEQIEEWGWSSRQLEKAVSEVKKSEDRSKEKNLKQEKSSKPYYLSPQTFKVVGSGDKKSHQRLEIDLGFGLTYKPKDLPHHFHEGDLAVLTSEFSAAKEKWKKTLANGKSQSSTKQYYAQMSKRSKGDVDVVIDLGFRVRKQLVIKPNKVIVLSDVNPSLRKSLFDKRISVLITVVTLKNSLDQLEAIHVHDVIPS